MSVSRVCVFLIFLSAFNGLNAITKGSALTVCYFSNWAISRPGIGKYSLDDIPVGLCSHVVYAFVGFSERSSFKITEMKPADDVNPNGLAKFSELRARLPRAKLVVSVGGWGLDSSKLSKMVAKQTYREQFIESVLSLLKAFALDGFNFHWLWPGHSSRGGVPADKTNFALLLKEMSNALDRDGHGRELSVTAPVEEFRINEGYAVADLCQYVDHVYLTTYDLRGSWNNFADVHTPMGKRSSDSEAFKTFNVMDGVALWKKRGCPAGKLVLGIATLGRTYTLQDPNNRGVGAPVTGPGIQGEFTQAEGYISYYEACKRPAQGWTVQRDAVGKVPYMYKDDQWIGYDDIESLKEKVDIVKQQGLAGTMIYALDMDDFSGLCGQQYPLSEFISSEMKKISAVTEYEITFGIDRESY